MASGGSVQIKIEVDPESIRRLEELEALLKRIEKRAKKLRKQRRRKPSHVQVVIHGDLGKGRSHVEPWPLP